jgi:mannose-6-phosphate isomerase-like protein (cupin superfamily)
MKLSGIALMMVLLHTITASSGAQYLRRSLATAPEQNTLFSTPSAHYMALFGEHTDSAEFIRGLVRYGNLKIDPDGTSKKVKFNGEETVIFVLDGNGLLNCGSHSKPVSGNDFIYIPSGKAFSFTNPRERTLSIIVMGFRIETGNPVRPSPDVMMASAEEVPFQVLGYHGPTTTFQLLMGDTGSTRDRLASACQVTSLFVMDFAAGGTNIPHRHESEEEIYVILRGKGDIVAGETPDGNEYRHPSAAGDAFFFRPGSLIGFYSGNGECEEHARILAVRFRYPAKQNK